MRAAIVCVLLLGCHSDEAKQDLGIADQSAHVDLVHAEDLASVDAGTTRGIACGDTPCPANAEYCCTIDQGKTGFCGFGDGAECGSAIFYCDGPEDCPPAEPACCAANGASSCDEGTCAGTQQGGYEMCHTNADCTGGTVCCASTSGGPYKLCLQAPCP